MSNATRSLHGKRFGEGGSFTQWEELGLAFNWLRSWCFGRRRIWIIERLLVLAVEIAVIHTFFGTKTLRGQIGRRCVHRTGCQCSLNSTRRNRAALDCWEPRVDAGDGGQSRDELSSSKCFDDRVVFGGEFFGE